MHIKNNDFSKEKTIAQYCKDFYAQIKKEQQETTTQSMTQTRVDSKTQDTQSQSQQKGVTQCKK